jgi:hypothetical protein
LYINSMPLIFAFRIVDCVLAMGVNFQQRLAVDLEDRYCELHHIALVGMTYRGRSGTNDGMFISLMRNYFAKIGDSAHPNHPDPRVRAITNFQELLVVAFFKFRTAARLENFSISSEMIARRRFRSAWIVSSVITLNSLNATTKSSWKFVMARTRGSGWLGCAESSRMRSKSSPNEPRCGT